MRDILFEPVDIPEGALERVRARVMAEAAPSARRARRLRLPLALAAVVVAAAAIFVLALGRGEQAGVAPAAAAVLNDAAGVAGSQAPLPPLTPGHFLYRKTGPGTDGGWTKVTRPNWNAEVRWIGEEWIGPDGRTTVRTSVVAGPRFPTAADRSAWIAAGKPTPWLPARVSHGFNRFYFPTRPWLSYRQLLAFEQHPGRLKATIDHAAQKVGARTPRQIHTAEFTYLTQMLTYDPLQPSFRAHAFQLLAQIPGVRVAGRLDRYTGRPSEFLTYRAALPWAPSTLGVVIDPTNAELIGRSHDGLVVCCYTPWQVVDSTAPRPKDPAGASLSLPSFSRCDPECIRGTVTSQTIAP